MKEPARRTSFPPHFQMNSWTMVVCSAPAAIGQCTTNSGLLLRLERVPLLAARDKKFSGSCCCGGGGVVVEGVVERAERKAEKKVPMDEIERAEGPGVEITTNLGERFETV